MKIICAVVLLAFACTQGFAEKTCAGLTEDMVSCTGKTEIKEIAEKIAKETDKEKLEDLRCDAMRAGYGCFSALYDDYKNVKDCPAVKSVHEKLEEADDKGCGAEAGAIFSVWLLLLAPIIRAWLN